MSREFERPATTPIPNMREDLSQQAGWANAAKTQSNQVMNGTDDLAPRAMIPPPQGQASPKQKIREINILPLDRGFVVKVGCQTVAIESASELVRKLSAYLTSPLAVETAYEAGLPF